MLVCAGEAMQQELGGVECWDVLLEHGWTKGLCMQG